MSTKIEQFTQYPEPRFAKWLFAGQGGAVIWLVARVYLGYEWLQAGWDKVFGPGRAAWMETGVAVKGFTEFAANELTKGEHPAVAYGWYQAFLEWIASGHYQWVAKVVAVSEVLVGAALILGAFTGIAAFVGAVMNFSYMFAGSAGVNPLFVLLAIGIILAWRVAGYYGADRYLLPLLGTPDRPGKLFKRRTRLMANTA